MKTFRLISLQIVEDVGLIDIHLDDGLIINKEDEQRNWVLEAYVSRSYEPYFSSLLDSKKNISMQIVISRKENDPAHVQGRPISIKELGEHVSVLFLCKMNRSRNDYAEQLLTYLISQGLSGTDLLCSFKEKMVIKPMLN
nr:YwpF-like family protein [uncultured Bacillus sp.]